MTMPRIKNVLRWLGLGASAYLAMLFALVGAFAIGGPNGSAARVVAGTWLLWSPVYRLLDAWTTPGWRGNLLKRSTHSIWFPPHDLLSQVAGARHAERDFRTGELYLLGAGMSGEWFPGTGGYSGRQLGPAEVMKCKVTWSDRDRVYVAPEGYAPISQPRPADLPAGRDEVTCELPDGTTHRLHVAVIRGTCIYPPESKGYNQRMLTLLVGGEKPMQPGA